MSEDNPYINNPLHGVGLKTVVDELVTHYGFDILYAYLNINCFRSNPSLAASVKFLKKTEWARERVEVFYMYQYKNLPAVSSEQFKLPPRERIVPVDQEPREPKVLSIEDGERLQAKRAANAANWDGNAGERKGSSRVYNERLNAGLYKSRGNQSSKPGSYKSGDKKTGQSDSYKLADGSSESKPAPAINPWANFRGGK